MRNLVCALAVTFLCVGKMMAAQMVEQAVEYVKINNTKVPLIFEESRNIPKGYVKLVFMGAGTLSDGKSAGLASLGAQILNEGSKTLGSAKFAQMLDDNAISLGASTSREFLSISSSFLIEKQDKAFELLADMLKSPNFSKSAFSLVKSNTINDLLANNNDYDYLANKHLFEVLYKGTPLGNKMSVESVKKITMKEVQNHLKSTMVLSNLVLVLGGDLDKGKTIAALQKALSSLSAGKVQPREHYKTNDDAELVRNFTKTEQAYVHFASPLINIKSREDAAKLRVASYILGEGGFGSRMMDEIRVKNGLAYSAYIRFVDTPVATYSKGYLQTKLESEKKAIDLVKQVVNKFVEEGVTQKELDDAKAFLLGSQPLREERLAQRLDSKLINFYKGLPLDFNKELLSNINNLNLKDLNDFIKSHEELKKLSFSVITAK